MAESLDEMIRDLIDLEAEVARMDRHDPQLTAKTNDVEELIARILGRRGALPVEPPADARAVVPS